MTTLAGPVETAAVPASEPLSPAPPAPPTRSGRVRTNVAAYVALTKPRIIELLLVTTVPTMVLAANLFYVLVYTLWLKRTTP